MSSTGAAIFERVARLCFPGEVVKSTATSLGSSTWVDNALNTGHTSTAAFAGMNIHIVSDAVVAGTTCLDDERTVTATGYTASYGIFAVSPTWPHDQPTTNDVALFYYGIHKGDMYEAVNDVIRTLELPRYVAMSLFTDGDMETSLTTNYTAIAGGTFVKTTTAGQVLTGTQALDLTVTASGDGVRTANLAISAYETLMVSVPILLSDATKSAKVTLYDATNSKDLFSVTVTGSDWEEARFVWTPGTTVENVQVRVTSNATGTWHVYIDNIAVLSNLRRDYVLPASIDDASSITEIVYLPLGRMAGTDTFAYKALSQPFEPWPWDTLKDYAAVTPHRVTIAPPTSQTFTPLFYKFIASGTALTLPTSTTVAPLEVVAEGAAINLFHKLATRSMDARKRAEFLQEALVHGKTYETLLNSIELGKPQLRYKSQVRV